jgi:prepilin-type N-terminal cleavage/methylation domain-containing protein
MLTSTALNTRRQQRGITLIEVSIGLIIAAIIAAAAFIAFQNNSRRAEIRDNVRQITEVIAETKQKIGLPLGYTGLDTGVAIRSGIVEEAAVADTSVNSYNGQIIFASVSADEARLTWSDVEEDQCGDLVIASLDGVLTVNTEPVVNGNLALADIETICTPPAGEEVVDIVYTFGRR